MKGTAAFSAAAAAALIGLAICWAAEKPADENPVVRYDRESRYHWIRVVDYPGKDRRCMRFSRTGALQSSMILSDPARLDLRYTQSMMAALALHPDPKDVLLIGLGGASIPRFLQKHFPGVRLDCVELDPDVVKVCQDWFEFKGAGGTQVIVMDGRLYLKGTVRRYDVILLDAFAAERIPFHLTTREFLELAKSRLKAGGAVAANLWEPGLSAAAKKGPEVSRFYFAELKTYQVTFPQVYLCKSGEAGKIILFASLDPRPVAREEWVKRAEALAAGKDFGFDLAGLIRTDYECLTGRDIPEKPLTDDLAPVDTLKRQTPDPPDPSPPKQP